MARRALVPELQQWRADIRRVALEEAARLCEQNTGGLSGEWTVASKSCARQIRDLLELRNAGHDLAGERP
jgi:hypothetical protein